MEVKHKGLLTKMSRGRSKNSANWKERYFELRVSKAAHSYTLQYSKGPGKKSKGEIRIDETAHQEKRIKKFETTVPAENALHETGDEIIN